MYPIFHLKLEIIFDKIVFIPLEKKKVIYFLLLRLHYPFNFKTQNGSRPPAEGLPSSVGH